MIVSKGFVFGITWWGNEVVYPARTLRHNTIEKLKEELESAKDLDGYDSGMGFREVLGVIYQPQEVIYKKEWKKTRFLNPILINRGMTIEQEEFLQEIFYSQLFHLF